MNFQDFDEYQRKLIDECIGMKDTKGKEYAHSEDRFANFNRLSEELGLKNYQIGYVYLKKHLDSIASFMKEGKTFSNEGIRGRFVDAIVYLTLIAGMVEEPKKVIEGDDCGVDGCYHEGNKVLYQEKVYYIIGFADGCITISNDHGRNYIQVKPEDIVKIK